MLIRYYGHVGLPTGYGDAAAEMCMAILGAGHSLEISTDGNQCHRRFLPLATCLRDEGELSEPDVVIVHTLPLDCPKVLAAQAIRDKYPRARTVAYTTWEGASFVPVEFDALKVFDQSWVPSRATYRAWPKVAHPHVVVVPHPFEGQHREHRPWSDDWPGRSEPDRPYRFYYVGAWTARKNVDGLIRAYCRTFYAEDQVELVIQSAGAGESACVVAQLSTGLADGPMPVIRFSNQRMSHEEIWALHHESDCFVTATRGEAWNLPAFDAMLAGKHIIAPAGLGHDDFLKESSACLYGSHLTPAFGDVRLVDAPDAPAGHAVAHYLATQGLTARSEWRDPDLIELGRMMRDAFTHRVQGLRTGYDPVARFGRAAVGAHITEILEALHE